MMKISLALSDAKICLASHDVGGSFFDEEPFWKTEVNAQKAKKAESVQGSRGYAQDLPVQPFKW